MRQITIETFDQAEFVEAIESGMEVSLDGPMSVRDIHFVIIEAFDDEDMIQLQSGPIPLEWKTGFVFGVLCGLFQHSLFKAYDSRQEDFQVGEFHRSMVSGGDMMVGETYSYQDIHELIVETVEESIIDDQGRAIPLESKTGFLFGALREIIVSNLVENNGDSDISVSDRR